MRVQSYLNNSKNIVTEKAKEFSALWNISSIVKLVIFNIYSVNNFKSEKISLFYKILRKLKS